jgi:hypothetical protein
MGICDPALRNALRTLKLSGMLDTLDARLAQTRNGGLGHLEFLQALRGDEIARRDAARACRTSLARRRRISHPLRSRRRRQNPCGTSTWTRCRPQRRRHPLRQNLPHALRSGGRPRRPQLGPTHPRIHQTTRAHPRLIPTPKLSRGATHAATAPSRSKLDDRP